MTSRDKNNGIATFTVRELAEELGISKQAVHKKINQLPTELTPKKVDAAYQLTHEIASFIRDSGKIPATGNQPVNQLINGEVDALKMMIKELQEEKEKIYGQLEKKDIQLDHLQKLIDQQQQLTLQANRQNERLQLQLELIQEKEDQPLKDEKIDSPIKKWWHFWKKINKGLTLLFILGVFLRYIQNRHNRKAALITFLV